MGRSIHGWTLLPAQVQYDTFITVYKSDCDFYPRVRAAGYKTLNYPEVWPAPVAPRPFALTSTTLACMDAGMTM